VPAPGWYTITAYPLSTVTQTFQFDKAISVVVKVQ
jgi:hypothetical protein